MKLLPSPEFTTTPIPYGVKINVHIIIAPLFIIFPSIDRLPYRLVNVSGNSQCLCQRSKQLQRNSKSRSTVLSLELEYSSHFQFLVPMPGGQVATRRSKSRSIILARIRIFKPFAAPSAYARGPGNHKEISTPGP